MVDPGRVFPDGSVLGHLRTNAKGANLNREWAAPAEDYAPEVACVLRRMQETGCDAFLDVHGDEEVRVMQEFRVFWGRGDDCFS